VWAFEVIGCRALRTTVAAAGLLLVAGAAFAQKAPRVTDADIERARQQHRTPSDAELARVPVPAAPSLDALPQPLTKTPLDLGAIAKGFDGPSNTAGLQSAATLLIFISFAMPEPTLMRLVDQAAQVRATLVLRGLVNGSLRETVERMQRLIGQRQVSVQIDPQAFDRFGIVATPTFVLVRGGAAMQPCSAGSCPASGPSVSAAGDVSVDYALAFMQRSAPQWAGDASTCLHRIQGAPR
jgi:conjugal transfer pilus assembly protein TrbC